MTDVSRNHHTGERQNVYYYKNDQEHLNETNVRLENNSSEWEKSRNNSMSCKSMDCASENPFLRVFRYHEQE